MDMCHWWTASGRTPSSSAKVAHGGEEEEEPRLVLGEVSRLVLHLHHEGRVGLPVEAVKRG